MPSNVINLQTVQSAIAALIDAHTYFGTDWNVYSYRVPEFHGRARNVVVTGGAPTRTIMAAGAGETDSEFDVMVYVFVLYESLRQQVSGYIQSGSNRVLIVENTDDFIVGNTVTIYSTETPGLSETATVTAISASRSITVGSLASSYTQPMVGAWSAQQSEEALNTAEKTITDIINDNQTNASYSRIDISRGTPPDSVVDEGGQTFRRTTITLHTKHYT